jgi:prephenate dehydrogenase
MVFAACMKKQEVPGTTFSKHYEIARGLLSEDNYLLSEILLNPFTIEQVKSIYNRLDSVIQMIGERNTEDLHVFFDSLRKNIGMGMNQEPEQKIT